MSFAKHAIAVAILVGTLSACAPKDPRDTLEDVCGGVLRVGLISAPPWVHSIDDDPSGIEVDLVRDLARELNAEVQWHRGSPEELFERLKTFEIDLVLAGLTDKSPWKETVALTRPYLEIRHDDGRKRHVWALPPGENGFLLYVERFLERHRQQARTLLEESR